MYMDLNPLPLNPGLSQEVKNTLVPNPENQSKIVSFIKSMFKQFGAWNTDIETKRSTIDFIFICTRCFFFLLVVITACLYFISDGFIYGNICDIIYYILATVSLLSLVFVAVSSIIKLNGSLRAGKLGAKRDPVWDAALMMILKGPELLIDIMPFLLLLNFIQFLRTLRTGTPISGSVVFYFIILGFIVFWFIAALVPRLKY